MDIYADACDRPPMGNDEINWGPWSEYGIFVSNGVVCEYRVLAISEKVAPLMRGIQFLSRLISFSNYLVHT